MVTVWSDSAPVGNNVSANVIRIKQLTATSGNVTISGSISNYVSNSNFQIHNITVDASAAVISPTGTLLSNSNYLLVVGHFDATTNMLTAKNITVFTPAAPTTVEIHGMVSSFISASSFTVRGVAIDTTNASFTGGTSAQLSNGAFLEIHGTVANNIVHATTVNFIALTPSQVPNGSIIEVVGTLAAQDPTTGTYTITMPNGGLMNSNMSSGVFYSNGTASNLSIGQPIDITGIYNNNLLTSEAVNFQTGISTAPGNLIMSGIAYNVTPTSFMLNGVTIQKNSAPIMNGGMGTGIKNGSMMGGSLISASVQLIGGQYIATAISLQGN